jgi:DNA-binding MarR family transcriptional regulator
MMESMDNQLAFMTPQHHAVRTFAVQELPRTGKPLSPAHIANALGLEPGLVTDLLTDLEKHLFFLVRNGRGDVNWAFPVTADRTPHGLRFSTGEKIFGA